MSIKNFEEHLKFGSLHVFTRDPDGSTVYGARDMGTIGETVNPDLNQTTAELKDSRSGRLLTVAQSITEQGLSYPITYNNCNPDNIAIAFAGKPPEAVNVSANPVTDARVDGVVGYLVPVLDASGEPVSNYASIESVTLDPDGTPVVLNTTDYETNDILRKLGFIKLIAGGDASLTSGSVVELAINYTPVARTGRRRIEILSAGLVRGYHDIFWIADNYQDIWRAHFYGSMLTEQTSFSVNEYSGIPTTITALADPNNADQPFGWIEKVVGDIPLTIQ